MKAWISALLAADLVLASSALSHPLPTTLSVTQRPPNSADGPPAYQQDMHWLDERGRSWAMRDVDGHAVWLYQEPAASVVDEIGGARPVAAFGTRRLTAVYAGPAFNLVREADGVARDVGFLPDGRLDEAAVGALCARAVCRVARWYDQSGNGNDAVQTVATARPVVRLSHRVGNSVSVVWDYEATSGEKPRWLTLPASLSIDSGSMGILWTGRFHNASMISPLIELGTDRDPFNFGFWDAHGDFYLGGPSQLSEIAGHAALSPSIGLISSSPTEHVVVNYRNRLLSSGGLKSMRHAGGAIGQTVAYKQSAMMELSSLIIYDRPLTPGDRFFGLQALGEMFDIPQQQQDTYVADGDSITQGIASPYLQSYPSYMERLLPDSLVLYDTGWAAKTIGGPGGLLERYPAFTAKIYNPNARHNIISLLAGTNDLQGGSSAQDVFRSIRSYAAAARQTGFKVVVGTILPRLTFTPAMETARAALNDMIRKSWSEFADGLADVAADPTLGPVGATGNTDVYASDGIHLTDYGYQVIAQVMAGAVSKLLN